MKTLLLLCLFLAVGCVSETTHEERFRDSSALSAPTISVSISNPDSFTFALVGDTHVGNADTTRLSRILTLAAAAGDSFIILLGDIVDKGEEQDVLAVKAAVAAAGFSGKALYVIGNHDVFGGGWRHFQNQFGPSHYSVTLGNSRFIALDTADGLVGREQFEWLREELRALRPTNTFVLSHYLPMVPGQRTYLKLADEIEALRLMKLASSHSVTGWLGAHYHSYAVEAVENVAYVVAGGAGGRRMAPIERFFYAQGVVNGGDVQFHLKEIE